MMLCRLEINFVLQCPKSWRKSTRKLAKLQLATVRWTPPYAMRLWAAKPREKSQSVNFDASKKATESEQKDKKVRRGGEKCFNKCWFNGVTSTESIKEYMVKNSLLNYRRKWNIRKHLNCLSKNGRTMIVVWKITWLCTNPVILKKYKHGFGNHILE